MFLHHRILFPLLCKSNLTVCLACRTKPSASSVLSHCSHLRSTVCLSPILLHVPLGSPCQWHPTPAWTPQGQGTCLSDHYPNISTSPNSWHSADTNVWNEQTVFYKWGEESQMHLQLTSWRPLIKALCSQPHVHTVPNMADKFYVILI